MSDDAANHFQKEVTAENQQKQRSYTLSITLQPDGSLEMTGPLQNKVLAFGLLGAASSKLTTLYMQSELVAAQKSRGGIDGLLKRMNGG